MPISLNDSLPRLATDAAGNALIGVAPVSASIDCFLVSEPGPDTPITEILNESLRRVFAPRIADTTYKKLRPMSAGRSVVSRSARPVRKRFGFG